MGFFSWLQTGQWNPPVPASSTDFIPGVGGSSLATIAANEPFFFPANWGNGYRRYGMLGVDDVRTAFARCAALQAVVSQKAAAITKGRVTVWNPKTEKAPSRGTTTGIYKEWEALFMQPNPYQSARRFFTQAYSYMQMFGWCAILPEYPIGFTDRPAEMYVIPNWLIEWEENRAVRRYNQMLPLKGWITNADGSRTELDMKRLIIIRDLASTDFDDWGLPVSRFSVCEQEVSNIIASLNARGSLITDRGANGILSNNAKDVTGHIPMDAEEKAQVQQQYRRYGNMSHQDKVIITSAALSWQPMTFDSEQLGLHPENIAALKSICNVGGFPFTMLAEGYEGKYNNSSNARRDFQDQTIDPESMDFTEQLSNGLKMYKDNAEAFIDYTGVASLQLSQREKGIGEQAMAQAMTTEYDLGIITRNEARERLGLDKITGKEGEFDKFKFETDSAIAAQQQINGAATTEEANPAGTGSSQGGQD